MSAHAQATPQATSKGQAIDTTPLVRSRRNEILVPCSNPLSLWKLLLTNDTMNYDQWAPF
ncbi:hypothetical protein SCLCIDRAFT_1208534 [Scleroderma citrinum Foug A]|uniref:Uncharacterized protein n=1 Tax=Scleroderma citrinum Foug A TaxID=1036808 RepID=A0A0C3EMR3_9AGAM|nr:hypothetical protein SCLCIDRAFT_1208534 [Scleroderma citrinum Foug A]